MTTITYKELADRLDAVFMLNKVPEIDEYIWDNLENGNAYILDEDGNETDEMHEVFQWYLICQRDAEYLKDHTDELVFYSEVLDEYVWGVTHFGTSWEGVQLNFYKDEEEKAKAQE